MALTGLYAIHIELTSKCNKNCWICGRRKIERDYPELVTNYGDMDIALVEKIAKQVPEGILIHFHNNGEPLLYPHLLKALDLFGHCIRHFDTNGKLLMKQYSSIIERCEVITVSVIPNDPDGDEQYEIVKKFLEDRGNRKPRVIIRFNGDVLDKRRWIDLGVMTIDRILHSPMGSYDYEKKVVIPEVGFCLEILNHLSIDRFGKVSPCVRFDPEDKLIIGDLNTQTLEEIWNGKKRKEYLQKHIDGKRNEIPLCNECEYWGIPRGLL
jgi:radical SAM protein with 4Fe4S-binding SPASM domain